MSSLVLDAGALIAIERHDRSMWAILAEARERGTETVIPATALAQVWRSGPRSAPIALLIEASFIDSLDEDRAKQVGNRLGARKTSDVTDAHVVSCAIDRRAAVATSDPNDIAELSDPDDQLTLIRV